MARQSIRPHVVAILAYAAVAVAYSWPLPLHFSTHLTGDVAGDTGVYVWNQWVFQRQLLEGANPYFTDAIFSLSSESANLSLHNYTPFQDLIALPLSRPLGVVGAFNAVVLFTYVLTAYVAYLLARAVTGRSAEAWVAGLAFAWSPVLVTRSMGHFSLVAAAPLAAFLLALHRTQASGRAGWRSAVVLGLSLGWATSTDVYYGIYCLLLGGLFVLTRAVTVARRDGVAAAPRWLDVVIVLLATLVASLLVGDGWHVRIAGTTISVRSLYTPVLLLTLAAAARAAWPLRVVRTAAAGDVWPTVRVALGAAAVAALVLSPLLVAFGVRVLNGRFESAAPYWRSSPPGVDMLALVVPNPNHPLAPSAWREWLTGATPDTYLENVASLPLVALAIVAGALWRGWRPQRWWVLVAVTFAALAMGPFVHIGGVNTFVPGPWALVRYVPLAGLARSPGRFTVVLTLALAVLLASGLTWATTTWPRRRRLLLSSVTALLLFELLPAPQLLHSASVPRVFEHVRASAPSTRVLNLPFGVRDGTSSEGSFSAQSQYFQTAHERRLIGGYLSRVTSRRRAELRADRVLDALITLSENRPLPLDRQAELRRDGPGFLRRANVGFVVVDKRRMPPALEELAVGSLDLTLVDVDGGFELYRPSPPAAP